MASGYVYAFGAPNAAYVNSFGQQCVTVQVGRISDGGEVLRVTDRVELTALIGDLTAAAAQWDTAIAADKQDGVSGR